MVTSPIPLWARAGRAIGRRISHTRNRLEWKASHLINGQAPWCRNQWGHRYQALSLSEYHYLRDGNPETFEALLLKRLLRPGMTVVDVGANHGLFSLEAAALLGPQGTIHAFEPTPRTRERLIENLRANDITLVRVFSPALGSQAGTARLRVHHEWSGLNTLARKTITWQSSPLDTDEVVEVPVTTLDQHCENETLTHIDFLKIDVEGFELDVLKGARRLLDAQRIRWIMLEVGDVTCANAEIDPADILTELGSRSYVVHSITSEGIMGSRVEAFPQGSFSANFLAFPKESF